MKEEFQHRHIGVTKEDENNMLPSTSLDAVVDKIIPPNIRLNETIDLPQPLTEYEYSRRIKEIGKKNKIHTSFMGQGYYPCHTPPVIKRNILENPGWYTQYTPYQAEVSQGRLEALLNFQTLIIDMVGLPIANASLLDEATAAAEAMMLLKRSTKDSTRNTFFISNTLFSQTIDVVQSRCKNLEIDCVVDDIENFDFSYKYFGCMLQYSDCNGEVSDHEAFVKQCKNKNIGVSVACDLLSLALLKPPGAWGVDIAFGSTQRWGMPMGFGGPHAAFFATQEHLKRLIPGRIIGLTKDAAGNHAFRMALQTREQHIRRDKATSNICTAQALPAIVASMYAVWHGPNNIRKIAEHVHALTASCFMRLKEQGRTITNQYFFDTIRVEVGEKINNLKKKAMEKAVNFQFDQDAVIISFDETKTEEDVNNVIALFQEVFDLSFVDENTANMLPSYIPKNLEREVGFLQHPVFNSYHSEHEMLRYMKSLENKDLSLCHSMIPLGSCTMKLNATTEMETISLASFANIHPFVPAGQVQGYKQIIDELKEWLCNITGFHGCSLQPNSGAQGEYAGLQTIRAYLKSQGSFNRNIVLIPSSAHGTNPASAISCGMTPVIVQCDSQGNIDIDDLKQKVEKHSDNLACLMITYPSTHGIFEEHIKEVCGLIHHHGGQVYMDGANLNAQIGLTSPNKIHADVCHINLHKTFCIPHGGGGPGMGPICTAKHLSPFLPAHRYDLEHTTYYNYSAVSSAAYGSGLILLISHAYISMMGAEGLERSSKVALLNANYIKDRLKEHYPILYTDKNGFVGHELIIDCRAFKKWGIEVTDIAKRLIDYSFHAPTVSFPVPGTLMIEPTESESKVELDRFCDAMIHIKKEILEIIENNLSQKDNILKNAPHTMEVLLKDNWGKYYSRERAAYPLNYLTTRKFMPPVSRVNDSFGDRNLICSCLPIDEMGLS